MILDAETGLIVDVNPFLMTMLDYSHEDFLGKRLWELGFFKDIAANEENFQELLQKKYIRYEDLPLETRHGKRMNVEFVSNVYQVDHHKVIQCNIRDITERKQAEAEMEALARFPAENPNPVLKVDTHGRLLYANPSSATLLNMWGCEVGEYLSQEWRKRVANSVDEQTNTLVDVLCGERIYSILIVPIAGFGYINLYGRDITERKRAEEELRASKKLLQDVVDNTAALVYILDLEGHFLLVNHKLETLFGLPNGQIVGQTRNAFLPAEFATQHRNNDLEIIQTGQGKLFEEEYLEPDGRHVYLTNKFPLFDTHDQVNAVCGISTDMTERKRMEEELHRSNTELEQFAYVASHDLQEPLRAVAGMVQLLQQRYQGKLDERADGYIGLAVDAADRMQRLINDLLNYSRVNRFGKNFEQVNTERLLNTVLANLQATIQESNARITHDPLPIVTADATQTTQLLQNLIGNALKFRGARPLHIHIGAEKIENAWRFAVRDNGIGIEPQYFERIFLVFQRLHTRREYPGTGIGLSLCKKIVERHGGQIWVESQPEQGATFYFTIPEKNI